MARELGIVTKDPYHAWWVLHRAVMDLATRQQQIRYKVAKALRIISPLNSDDFPPDLCAQFSVFEAKIQAQIIAVPKTDSGPLLEVEPLPAIDQRFESMTKKLTVPTCYEIAREIAGLYEMLSQALVQGGDDLTI
jgi:hypothetical protein